MVRNLNQLTVWVTAWARRRDEEIIRALPRNPQENSWRIFNFLQREFYPSNGARILSPADKFIAWFIFASLGMLTIEIMGWLLNWNNILFIEISSASIFFTVFFTEFWIRTWLKGWVYLKNWGFIDIFVVLADFSTLIILLFFPINGPYTAFLEAFYLLRTLRLIRLLRFFRLLRIATHGPTIRRMLRRLSPYLLAVTITLFRMAIIAFIIVCVIWATYGTPPNVVFLSFLTAMESILSLPSEDEEGLNVLILIAALFTAATIVNIFGLFFSPILRDLKDQQTELDKKILLVEHIVICVNDFKEYSGILEEFLKVFREYANMDVVVIYSENYSHELEELSGRHLRFIKGDVSSASVWAKAYPERARAIVVLGKGALETNDSYAILVRGPNQDPSTPIPIFIVSSQYGHPEERLSIGDDLCKIIEMSPDTLIDLVEENTWNKGSIQHALLKQLIVQLDNDIGFPELGDREYSLDATTAICSALEAHGKGNLDVIPHRENIRVCVNADSSSEVAEVEMFEAVREVLRELPDFRKVVNIFLYVDTLDLLRWNDIFSEDQDNHVSVFPIELSVPLAIYHECEMPGALKFWYSDLNKLKAIEACPKKDGSAYSRTKLAGIVPGLSPEDILIGVQYKQEGELRHRVFLDHLTRVVVNRGDKVLVLER